MSKNIIILLRIIVGILYSLLTIFLISESGKYLLPLIDIHQLSDWKTTYNLWDTDQKITLLFILFIFISFISLWVFVIYTLYKTPISIESINKTKLINRIMLRSGLITVVGLSASANINQMHQNDNISTVSSTNVHQATEEKQPAQNIDNKTKENNNVAQDKQQEIYTIKKGDSLWTIGGRLYNEPIRYKEIVALNNNRYTDGTHIKLNVLTPGKQLYYIKDNNTNHKTSSDTTIVTLKSGDTLSDISQKYLGDASRWHEIANFNKITNPHTLQVGDTINIPHSIINHTQENKIQENKKEEKKGENATELTIAPKPQEIKPNTELKQKSNQASTLPSQQTTIKPKTSSPLPHMRNDTINHSNNNSTISPVMITTFVSAPVILALILLAYKRNKRKQIERVKRESPDANIKIVEDKVLPINKTIYNDILKLIQQLVNYLSAIDKESSIFYILAKKDRFRVCFEFPMDDERLTQIDDRNLYDILYEDLADVNMYAEKSAIIELGQVGEDRLLIDLFHLHRILYVPYKSIQERIMTSFKYAEWTTKVEVNIVGDDFISESNLDNKLINKSIVMHNTVNEAIEYAHSEEVQSVNMSSLIFINKLLTIEETSFANNEVITSESTGICIFGSNNKPIGAIIELIKDDQYRLKINNISIKFRSDIEEVKTVKAIEGRQLYVGTTTYSDPEIITTKREEKKKPRFIVHFFDGMKIIDTKTGKSVPNFGKISVERMGYYILHDVVKEDFMRNIYGQDAVYRMNEDIHVLNKHIRKCAEDTKDLKLITSGKDLYGKTFTVDRSICDGDFKLIDDNNFIEDLKTYIKHPIPPLTELPTEKTFNKIETYVISRISKHINNKFKLGTLEEIPTLIDIGLKIDDQSHEIWGCLAKLSEINNKLSNKYIDLIKHFRWNDNENIPENLDYKLIEYQKIIQENS